MVQSMDKALPIAINSFVFLNPADDVISIQEKNIAKTNYPRLLAFRL